MIAKYNRKSWQFGLPGLLIQVLAYAALMVWSGGPEPFPGWSLALVAVMLIGGLLLWIGIGFGIVAKRRSLWWLLLGITGLIGLIVLAMLKDYSTPEDGELVPRARNRPASWAMYMGLASILPIIGVLFAIPAIICAIIGLRIVRRDPERGGRALAWSGIWLPLLWMCMYGLMILVSSNAEVRRVALRDATLNREISLAAAWTAIEQAKPESEQLIAKAALAGEALADRLPRADRALTRGVVSWTAASQRATLALNQLIQEFLGAGGLDPATLDSRQTIEARARLIRSAKQAAETLVGLYSEAGEEMLLDELLSVHPDARARDIARKEMQVPIVRTLRAKNVASMEVCAEGEIILDLLARHFGAWQLGEDGVLLFAEDVPDADIDAYQQAVSRLNEAADRESEALTRLQGTPNSPASKE